MKPIHLIPYLVAFILSSCVSLSIGQSATYGIAVVVNGEVITKSEVRDAVAAQEQLIRMTIKDPNEQQAKLGELRESALYSLIERQLILSEFTKLGGSIRSEYVEDDVNSIIRENFEGNREKFLYELAKNGMTMKKFREQRQKMMIVSVLRSRQVKDLPPPTPAQVDAFYQKNADKFRDKDFIKFSTITIPKYPVGDSTATSESQKKLALEIRSKVSSGADFATMAKTYSQDSRAELGGDWGLQERKTLSPELADVAFALKAGSVSKVTELGSNYMIIYCEAKQPGNLEPLEKVRPMIERAIQSEMGKEAVTRWINSLAKKAIIQPDDVKTGFLEWIQKQN
jgi:parvulin-like peptidyl-prolyl isomerase